MLKIRRETGLLVLALWFLAVFFLILGSWVAHAHEATTKFIQVGGEYRSYDQYVPPGISPAGHSVVIVLHGGYGTPEAAAEKSRMESFARDRKFVAIFPRAQERHWKDGRSADQMTYAGRADVRFIDALITKLVTSDRVNPQRIFVAGMSNGGIMTHRLACESKSNIAGFAAVVGNMGASMGPVCRPIRLAPFLQISGDADPMMPWAGGPIASGNLPGSVWGVEKSVQFWESKRSCAGIRREIAFPDVVPGDGSTAARSARVGCPVVLVRIKGGQHDWPGTSGNMDVDATAFVLGQWGL